MSDVSILGLPDGGCSAAPPADPIARIAGAIARARPHLVVTFGPDGITGHADHVAVHRWTTDAWWQVRRRTDVLPTGARLLYATMTHDFVDRHRREMPELPLTLAGEPVSIDASEVALRVEPTHDELRRKAAALDAHASQTDVLAGLVGRERLHGWWRTETFRAPTADELATPSPQRLQVGSKRRSPCSSTVGA